MRESNPLVISPRAYYHCDTDQCVDDAIVVGHFFSLESVVEELLLFFSNWLLH